MCRHTKNTALESRFDARTHLSSKLQVLMEHSGAISCSLKVDMDDAANSLVSCTGHWKPNDENTDTTCTGTTG
jgi:hypothetical protein